MERRDCGWSGILTRRGVAVAASALVLGACLVMRVLGAKWYALHGNPDYAVVVLMVRHMLAGVDFPVFFYGQPYMGSLEPAFSALLGLFLGPTPFAVCLGTGLMAFAMVVAVHRLAWRIGGPVAAVAASALCLVGPDGYFHYMASPRGGYALGLLLTTMLLHEAVFFGAEEGDAPGVKARRFLPLGLLVGLSFWNFWLTMPAVGVVCVMLLWRLRLRLFRPSVLACGLLGFFAGSLPWWVWNARHGWQSLGATGASPGVRQSIETAVRLFTERLPALFESPGAPGGTWLGLGVLLVLLALALAAAFPRSGGAASLPLRRLLCACFLFLGAFTAAYALSSFGAINSRRYLLPFVPVFATLAGSGIGVLARAAAAATRKTAFGLRAAAGVGILCVVFEVAGRMPDLQHHRRVKTGWHDSARTLASKPELPKEFLADFMHYGVNWATDEEVCAVSPKLYRYAPYFERLENADNPGVLENFRGFDHFLLNTGARSDFIRLPGYRVHFNATPPSFAFGVLPSAGIASMTDSSGRDWKAELTDCNGETIAPLPAADADPACELTIAFKEPVAVCGLRVISRARHAMESWGVEGRTDAGGAWRELSGMYRETGYYWSGDRFYFAGIAHRSQKVFPETQVLELRVKMPLHPSCPGVSFETVQILTADGPRAAFDLAAAARRIQDAGVTRVFADRWHARELHRLSGGALWTSRQTVETERNALETVRVPREANVAVVVEDALAAVTHEAFREAGAAAETFSVGGLTVFRLVPETSGAEEKADLMFYSGMLHADRVPALPKTAFAAKASFFGGGLVLRGISDFRRLDAAGSRVAIELAWEVEPGFLFPNNLAVFVHGLDESGRIVCQVDEGLSPDLNPYHERLGTAFSSVHKLSVPAAAEQKPVRLELGLLELGFLPRRAKPDTDLEVDDRQVVLPVSFSDAAPAQARDDLKRKGEKRKGSENAAVDR